MSVGAKRGERRTIVTSSRFIYTAPFNTGPEGEHGFPPSPGPNEYRAYYKNEEDMIGQLPDCPFIILPLSQMKNL
jgi:hypothetical protein